MQIHGNVEGFLLKIVHCLGWRPKVTPVLLMQFWPCFVGPCKVPLVQHHCRAFGPAGSIAGGCPVIHGKSPWKSAEIVAFEVKVPMVQEVIWREFFDFFFQQSTVVVYNSLTVKCSSVSIIFPNCCGRSLVESPTVYVVVNSIIGVALVWHVFIYIRFSWGMSCFFKDQASAFGRWGSRSLASTFGVLKKMADPSGWRHSNSLLLRYGSSCIKCFYAGTLRNMLCQVCWYISQHFLE